MNLAPTTQRYSKKNSTLQPRQIHSTCWKMHYICTETKLDGIRILLRFWVWFLKNYAVLYLSYKIPTGKVETYKNISSLVCFNFSSRNLVREADDSVVLQEFRSAAAGLRISSAFCENGMQWGNACCLVVIVKEKKKDCKKIKEPPTASSFR